MNLIAILLVLAADRYTDILGKFRCYQWFSCYTSLIEQKVLTKVKLHPVLALLAIFLPLIVVVVLVQCLLFQFWWGIFGWLFNLAILFYCMPDSYLRRRLNHYFEAQNKGDNEAAYLCLNLDNPKAVEDASSLHHEAVKHILVHGNQATFTMIFWFVLLGGVGAIVYRFLLEFNNLAKGEHSKFAKQQPLAEFTQQLFDWVPVRIVALGYGLVGNFMGSFIHWLQMLPAVPALNNQLLIETGLHALSYAGSDEIPESAEIEAIDLVDRVMVVFLVIIAMLTLAMWLG